MLVHKPSTHHVCGPWSYLLAAHHPLRHAVVHDDVVLLDDGDPVSVHLVMLIVSLGFLVDSHRHPWWVVLLPKLATLHLAILDLDLRVVEDVVVVVDVLDDLDVVAVLCLLPWLRGASPFLVGAMQALTVGC